MQTVIARLLSPTKKKSIHKEKVSAYVHSPKKKQILIGSFKSLKQLPAVKNN